MPIRLDYELPIKLVNGESDYSEHWWLEKLLDVYAPIEYGGEGRNAIIVISGMPGSGKSEIGFDFEEQLDPSFIESFRNETPHFSVSVRAFIRAMRFLDARELGHPIFWHIDEPVDIRAKNWWTGVASALHDHLDTMRFKKIFLVVCGPVMERMNPYLRDICRFWIRTHHPGIATIEEFVPKRVKHPPWEVMRPHPIGRLNCFGHRASDELRQYIQPLKEANFKALNEFWIDEMERRDKKAKWSQFRG